MTVEQALTQLKTILGKNLYPAAVPEVEKVLKNLEGDSYEAGYEQAQETVGDWYEPRPPGY